MKKIVLLLTLTALMLLLTQCVFDTDEESKTTPSPDNIFVLGTKFGKVGQIQSIDMDSLTVTSLKLEVAQNSKILSHGKFIYVLQQYGGDNIKKIDPSKSGSAAILYEKPLGDYSNPSDVVFINDTNAYISLYGFPKIYQFNPETGNVMDSISIAQFSFKSNLGVLAASPNAQDMEFNNGKLYVALQRINDDFSEYGSGMILVIDVTSNKIVDTLITKNKNPAQIQVKDNNLLVASLGAGWWGVLENGGIESIDLTTKTPSLVISDFDLGGDPMSFAHKSGNLYYVVCYTADTNVSVKLIDINLGSIVKTLEGIKNSFGGIFYESTTEQLFVAEQNPTTAGVIVFDKNEIKVKGPIPLDLPPNGFVLLN